MSSEFPGDEWGRDEAYKQACSCPFNTVGWSICENFRALYYEYWPKCLRRVGEGGVGRFYKNNRALLLKELNEDNAQTWAVAETNFFNSNVGFVAKYLGKMFTADQRARMILKKGVQVAAKLAKKGKG
jgi:hypothetical protein